MPGYIIKEKEHQQLTQRTIERGQQKQNTYFSHTALFIEAPKRNVLWSLEKLALDCYVPQFSSTYIKLCWIKGMESILAVTLGEVIGLSQVSRSFFPCKKCWKLNVLQQSWQEGHHLISWLPLFTRYHARWSSNNQWHPLWVKWSLHSCQLP